MSGFGLTVRDRVGAAPAPQSDRPDPKEDRPVRAKVCEESACHTHPPTPGLGRRDGGEPSAFDSTSKGGSGRPNPGR